MHDNNIIMVISLQQCIVNFEVLCHESLIKQKFVLNDLSSS